MDVLNQIIEKLTKEELRFFKFYLGAMPGDDRKDLLLVNYVRQSRNKFDEAKVIEKLNYDSKNKNNYYRLKNRVIEDIGDSLTLLYTHKKELYELQHFLTLYQIYYSKSLFKTCLFYLKKAKRLAVVTESFELLDMVYANFIRLSADLVEINPDPYIVKRKANAKLVSQLQQLDDLLATVTYRLKLSQNFASSDKRQLDQLQQLVRYISKQTTSHFGTYLQTRIYKALSQIFLQQHNYTALEKLVIEYYNRFGKEGWFRKENHDLKLQMLTYLGNALYKNKKFKESLGYLKLLGDELLKFDKLHYDRFLFFYYNLQILNNAAIDPGLALKYLDEFEQLTRKKKNYYHDIFIYLNRAGLLYDTKQYKDALKSLVKLYVNDNFRKSDKSFRFKVEMSELIITYEAGDYETLLYRIKQVKKDYKVFSTNKRYRTDFAILNLLTLMVQSRKIKRDEKIQKEIKSILRISTNETKEDSEIIKYSGWLQTKLTTE